MSFCEHCEGQRFDRARVLRALRDTRKQLQAPDEPCTADHALKLAIDAVRALDIPHLDWADDSSESQLVH
jgi:hypothetical protein